MDVGLVLKKQIDELYAQGDIEAALVAGFSALQVEPLNVGVLMSCAAVFTRLQCPSEAKTVYFICLGLGCENGLALERLKQLHEVESVLVLPAKKPLYVKKIMLLLTKAIASESEKLAELWQRLEEDNSSQRYWVAACLMKFCLPFLPPDEQGRWLEKFRGFIEAIDNTTLRCKKAIIDLSLEEKYLYSSLRYAVTNFYLSYDVDPGDNVLPFVELVSCLSAMAIWQLGCLDQEDLNILEKILQLFSRFKPGLYPDYRQFLVCSALMLFRQPHRVCRSMDSDAIFHFYLDMFRKQYPQQKENVYCGRVLASFDLPQEKALWFIENYADLAKFRDKHVGESCYIIGNGPSLKRMDLSPLRDKITFGLNKIYLLFDKLGFDTSYLVAANAYVLQQAASEFAGLTMPQFLMIWGREFIKKQKNVIFLRENTKVAFSDDLTQGASLDCTVTHMALQLAYYMGFKTVILIGVDHNFVSQGNPHTTVTLTGEDPNHFDPSYFGFGIPWQLPDLEGSERAYRNSKKIFEDDGRIILDATVEGKLQVFQKIDYQESLKIS